jgi:hypothetical protein
VSLAHHRILLQTNNVVVYAGHYIYKYAISFNLIQRAKPPAVDGEGSPLT